MFYLPYVSFLDDNRSDIHSDDDIKRQRLHYSGDQIYSNVRDNLIITLTIIQFCIDFEFFFFCLILFRHCCYSYGRANGV